MSKIRSELFRIVEPAIFHNQDKEELDRALDALIEVIEREKRKIIYEWYPKDFENYIRSFLTELVSKDKE